jgi:hypothetical protein
MVDEDIGVGDLGKIQGTFREHSGKIEDLVAELDILLTLGEGAVH